MRLAPMRRYGKEDSVFNMTKLEAKFSFLVKISDVLVMIMTL